MDLSPDRMERAIRWRMGLAENAAEASPDWETIEDWLQDDPRRLDGVVFAMTGPLREILSGGLIEEGGSLPALWKDLRGYLQGSGLPMTRWMAQKAASYIAKDSSTDKGAGHDPVPNDQTDSVTSPAASAGDESSMEAGSPLEGESPVDESPTETGEVTQSLTEPQSLEETGSPSAGEAIEAQSAVVIDSSTEQEPMTEGSASADLDKISEVPEALSPDDEITLPADQAQESAEAVTQPDTNPPSVSTQWQYLPVPEGPDKHDEFDQRAGVAPVDLKIIGARARGKKHKHEGTNCDDWFEFGVSGDWTIIAVSDGAGSKVLSRIGARTSCETALKELSDTLEEFSLKVHSDWSGAEKDKKEIFAEDDLARVRAALHDAMNKAYDAVAAKATQLAEGEESEAYAKLLNGRAVTLDDLSGTLLLAVHTTVAHEGIERSFVMTCQIGDGMLAAVDGNGGLQLLGVADSGEFAGQTEFLTSKKKLDKTNLASKTFAFFGPIQALMVMTDGVADDYFPNDPDMLRLYGDLAINGIIRFPGLTASEVGASLAETKLTDTKQVEEAGIAIPVDRILPEDQKERVFIHSFDTYVDKLGLAIKEVVKSPPLLVAGTAGEPLCSEHEPEDLLRVWLDSYNVRGSFDDRTLVVLYREKAS